MVTEKENILNSLTWFYEFLKEYDITDLQYVAHMFIVNDMALPISTDDGEIILDDDGYMILADWKYEEV